MHKRRLIVNHDRILVVETSRIDTWRYMEWDDLCGENNLGDLQLHE